MTPDDKRIAIRFAKEWDIIPDPHPRRLHVYVVKNAPWYVRFYRWVLGRES